MSQRKCEALEKVKIIQNYLFTKMFVDLHKIFCWCSKMGVSNQLVPTYYFPRVSFAVNLIYNFNCTLVRHLEMLSLLIIFLRTLNLKLIRIKWKKSNLIIWNNIFYLIVYNIPTPVSSRVLWNKNKTRY